MLKTLPFPQWSRHSVARDPARRFVDFSLCLLDWFFGSCHLVFH
jgi:hypothetical protein